MLNYNKLKYFSVVAKRGNISKAAAELYIGQPALSVHMKELEEEIGVQLFHRGANHLSLTDAGSLLYERTRDFFAQEDRLLHDVRQAALQSSSNLVIGTIGSQITDTLAGFAQEFRKEFSSVKVEIGRYNINPLTEQLKNGSVDIGFTMETELNSPAMKKEFQICPVEQGWLLLAVNKFDPLAEQDAVKLSEVKEASFIALDPKTSGYAYDHLIGLCRQAGFEPKITEIYEYIEPMLMRINLSQVVTITSDLAPLKAYSNIKCLRLIPEEPFAICMCWKKNCKKPAVQLFVNKVLDSLKGAGGIPNITL